MSPNRMTAVSVCPWGVSQLKKLGRCIRDEVPVPPSLPQYEQVMLWYNDLAIEVQSVLAAIEWRDILGDREPEITSRSKTIDTLRQKLQRDHNTPLPSIQDIAGVRIEAEMNLDEQDLAAAAVVAAFPGIRAEIHDLRDGAHSGYRSVHVWLWLEGGRAEVQIRTHIQGAWANTYEAAGDAIGRGIRYGEIPEDPVAQSIIVGLQEFSLDRGVQLENMRTDLDRMMVVAKSLKTNRKAITQRLRRSKREFERFERTYQEDMLLLKKAFQGQAT